METTITRTHAEYLQMYIDQVHNEISKLRAEYDSISKIFNSTECYEALYKVPGVTLTDIKTLFFHLNDSNAVIAAKIMTKEAQIGDLEIELQKKLQAAV